MKNNNKWSQLSMQQRADLIKLYTDNGITNIKDIRNHYNSFGDGGETNKYEKEAKSFLTNWYRNPTTQQMMGELDKTDYERFPVIAPSGATVTDPSLARRVKVNTALNTPSNYVEMPDGNLGGYLYNPTDTSKNEVQVNKDFMNDINSKFIFTHEYEHGIQHEMPFVLGTTQPVEHNLKPGVVEDPYLDSRKETRSRIMEAREFLNLDPSKRDYTPEEAAEFQTRLREGEGYIGTASDLDRLTPETLAGYLNYMADAQIDTNFSTYDNETVSYAKNGGKLNNFGDGGYRKGVLNKEKIIRNVPAREWGPYRLDENYNEERGEGTNFKTAAKYYYDNSGHGLKNEELANKVISEFEAINNKEEYNEILDPNYVAYQDAISYRNHVEALKKYLGLPYNKSIILESQYQPTKSIGTNDKYYKFASHANSNEIAAAIEDMVYSGNNEQQYVDNTLNTFTAYRDMDEKGDFVSILDEWDYNPSVYGGNKKYNKIIDIITGGKSFDVYDRFYLDDYYNIPEEFRGNPFISPAIVTALSDQTKQDLIDQNIPEEEWEFVLNENSFLNGGKFLTKRRK